MCVGADGQRYGKRRTIKLPASLRNPFASATSPEDRKQIEEDQQGRKNLGVLAELDEQQQMPYHGDEMSQHNRLRSKEGAFVWNQRSLVPSTTSLIRCLAPKLNNRSRAG